MPLHHVTVCCVLEGDNVTCRYASAVTVNADMGQSSALSCIILDDSQQRCARGVHSATKNDTCTVYSKVTHRYIESMHASSEAEEDAIN